MIIVFMDDCRIGTFESPESPPTWVEWIDVKDGSYQFYNERGQQYRGALLRRAGFFRAERWNLVATGVPELAKVIALLDRAHSIDETCSDFSDLESLRRHVLAQDV
jgi:hypothetical protein